MPPVPERIEKAKVLAVEGKSEFAFFLALLAHLNISEIQVAMYEGVGNLPRFLKALKVMPGHELVTSVGIVRDADLYPRNALAAVKSALQAVGWAVPLAHGTMAGTAPQIGIWLMPDGTSPGAIENLCLDSLGQPAEFGCIDAFLSCAVASGLSTRPGDSKARAAAWLALQAKPNLKIGEAASAGYWPWASASFQPLISFLRSL